MHHIPEQVRREVDRFDQLKNLVRREERAFVEVAVHIVYCLHQAPNDPVGAAIAHRSATCRCSIVLYLGERRRDAWYVDLETVLIFVPRLFLC